MSNSAWDTNFIAASAKYISINWNASGGGAFAILPLPSPFSTITAHSNFPQKLPDTLPLARSHTAPVLDTSWSYHDDSLVASGGEDGKLMLWKVEDPTIFDDWMTEGWVPKDFDPILRVDASARKVGQVEFHPTAANVVATASGDHVVKLWDLANPEAPRTTLGGHGDTIQSMCFNRTGTLLATTARDRKIRMFDPRAGGDAVRTADSHSGIKGSRVVWCGDLDMVATTGFSKMSERQAALWNTGSLETIKMMPIDQSSGVIMPFWADNGILFLAGKGDGNIRYYEYTADSSSLAPLDEYTTSVPQRGMCFLPRRALSIHECEIARAYKIHGTTIEPTAFIVPRKAGSFQSDIYPPVPSTSPTLSASEFFDSDKPIQVKMVDLASGSVATTVSSSVPPKPAPAVETTPIPTPVSAAPAPKPAAAPQPAKQTSLDSPVTPQITKSASEPPPAAQSASNDAEVQSLKTKNTQLENELREARAKIRELELKVESVRANAKKAAEALLGGGM